LRRRQKKGMGTPGGRESGNFLDSYQKGNQGGGSRGEEHATGKEGLSSCWRVPTGSPPCAGKDPEAPRGEDTLTLSASGKKERVQFAHAGDGRKKKSSSFLTWKVEEEKRGKLGAPRGDWSLWGRRKKSKRRTFNVHRLRGGGVLLGHVSGEGGSLAPSKQEERKTNFAPRGGGRRG